MAEQSQTLHTHSLSGTRTRCGSVHMGTVQQEDCAGHEVCGLVPWSKARTLEKERPAKEVRRAVRKEASTPRTHPEPQFVLLGALGADSALETVLARPSCSYVPVVLIFLSPHSGLLLTGGRVL